MTNGPSAVLSVVRRLLGERTGLWVTMGAGLVAITVIGASRFARVQGEAGPREPIDVGQHWPALIAGGHWSGERDAEVVMVVFSDFQCPFCAELATSTLPALREAYGERLAVVFRHWPLTGHARAMEFAEAAECAGRQGRFWEFHDELFESQGYVVSLSLDELVARIGVPDLRAYQECLRGTEVRDAVESDVALAKEIGATGTPTVVVNGMKVRSGGPIEEIRALIGEALGTRVGQVG